MMNMEQHAGNFKKLILRPSFNGTIAEMNEFNIQVRARMAGV